MATYAIGDIHGCYKSLRRLLQRIDYDPRQDRLWQVGDLVNRGPRSLDVLRWAVDAGERLTVVLGNHDLHLLAVAEGVTPQRGGDTFKAILDAKDADDLLIWLRSRPLAHAVDDHLMVHAGVFPSWTVDEAVALAREVEANLARPEGVTTLAAMHAKDLPTWSDDLDGLTRRQVILAALTRLRLLDDAGGPVLAFKGRPGERVDSARPWFRWPDRATASQTIVCGHWSALGLLIEDGLYALDSGCVFGGSLSAIRLDDGKVFQQRLAD